LIITFTDRKPLRGRAKKKYYPLFICGLKARSIQEDERNKNKIIEKIYKLF